MSLLGKIKELCMENNTNLATLEKTLSLGNGTISRWDSSSPSADKLSRVADHFDVSTDYLLGRTEDRTGTLTIAAHKNNGEEWTEEELKKIEDYKRLLLLDRKNK